MPHTPEVDAIHPFGKIPAMRHGDLMLGESRAICSYVDRTFDGPQLVPADPIKAVQVEQWVSIINTHIDPTWIRQYVGAGYIFPGTPDKSPNRTAIEAALPKMQQQFPVMDKAVKSGYLVGNSFTLADMDFMPILYYMTKFPESSELVAGHPNLKAYFERHVMRKSVQESIPESAPGTAGQKTEPVNVARAVNA
jgi:glutathione S-transferase